MRHFLHPKLLRKAREVRVQLEDIMKFQKMEIISAGTDFDVIRFVGPLYFPYSNSQTRCSTERRLLLDTSIKQPE